MIRRSLILVLVAASLACDQRSPASVPGEIDDVPVTTQSAAPERSAHYYYKRATRTLGFGLYDAAIADADLALDKDPLHAPSLTLRAMARLEMLLRELADDDSGKGRVGRGPLRLPADRFGPVAEYERLVAESARIDESDELVVDDPVGLEAALSLAQSELTSEIARAPTHGAYLLRGVTAYRQGRFEDALADFEAAVAIRADEAAWTDVGITRERLGDVAAAMTAYEKALAGEGVDLAEWLDRGVEPETFRWLPASPGGGLPKDLADRRRRLVELAGDDLEAALEIDPGDVRARELRGLIRLLEKRPSEARADLEVVVRDDPVRARSWYLLSRAILAEDAREIEAARRAWRRAWKLDAHYLLVFHDASWLAPPDVDHVFQELKGMR